MGGALSHFFQSGHALLSSGHQRSVSEQTRRNVRTVFDALCANPKVTVARLEGLLSNIPKSENILQVHNEEGYNLLQRCVGLGNVDLARWCLTRNIDINRGACSLPLHIACHKGSEEMVELLLKHGARVDVEARMCWPGPHQQNCEERSKQSRQLTASRNRDAERESSKYDKLQCAIYYAIDGDQVDILELLAQQGEDHWLPWQQKRPLLHIACERGSWDCVKYLVSERSDEINQCYDEYYPIHQASLHDLRFLELLIQCGADTQVRTSTQQMTALHVVLLEGKKSAEDTLLTAKMLMEHGLRDMVNAADSLGNTALHLLIVRYALEERRYGYHNDDHQPWNRWDMLHITRYLLQNGAKAAINQTHNSALACVLRHIVDWEFRYDLLHMLLQEGGDPNVEGRDGSVPLMVCLVPLINKDPLHHFTHTMKVCYLNCVRILCKYGANPNCYSRSHLTPLHVLVFTASENISLAREEQKAQGFEFIRKLLTLLLQHGLDPNIRFSQRCGHILHSLMDMVVNARIPSDLNYVYDLTLTLIQYGANPNAVLAEDDDDEVDSEQRRRRRQRQQQARRRMGRGAAAGPGERGPDGIRRPVEKTSNQIMYHFVMILINRGDKVTVPGDSTFARILRLYYLSMNHVELYSCLKILYQKSATMATQTALCSVVKDMCTKPRTLKQLARVVIYNALDQRPALHVNKLSLPPSLKEYILNFEP